MRFNNLGRYKVGGTKANMQLAVPLPRTPSGKVYRYSPSEKATPRHFVLGDFAADFNVGDVARKRMKLDPRSNKTVCPYTGVIAADTEFTHPDDVQAAIKTVEHAAISDVEAAFRSIFDGFNRKTSRNSLFQLTATVNSKRRAPPRFYRRDLLRELMCDHCGREYGVYAIGLFCPDCGAPNLRLHFAREVQLVKEQVSLADADTLKNQELAYRLLGNAHEDVLTAFEATLKTMYFYAVDQRPVDAEPVKLVKNDFQNVEIAQRRFAEFNFDPFHGLSEQELASLKLNIQKRHIIGHNLGVVDAKFAEHASDARLGETVHLVGNEIRAFAEVSQRVVDSLDEWLVAR